MDDAPRFHIDIETDDLDAETQTGWSVLVQGTMSAILDLTEVARLDQLELAPWLETSRPHWVRIVIERISGRAIEHHPR